MVAKRLVVAVLLGLGSASVLAQTAGPSEKQAATATPWQSLSFEAFVDQAAAGLADQQPADAATRQALLEHAWQAYLSEEAKLATLDRPRLLRLVRLCAPQLSPAQRQPLAESFARQLGQPPVLSSLSPAELLAWQDAATALNLSDPILAQAFVLWAQTPEHWTACRASDVLALLKLSGRLKAPAGEEAARLEAARQLTRQQAMDRSLAKEANLPAMDDKIILLQLAGQLRLGLTPEELKQYRTAIQARYVQDQAVLAFHIRGDQNGVL